jgi:hypothetical protein
MVSGPVNVRSENAFTFGQEGYLWRGDLAKRRTAPLGGEAVANLLVWGT